MASSTRLAWLFDVDGTLLLTEGAAREAFACAVRDHLGVGDDLQDIGFAGRIEPLILRDILRKHGRSLDCAEEARFWDSRTCAACSAPAGAGSCPASCSCSTASPRSRAG
jgi:FMN phosphatase YigB (HAD superfamily)